MRAGHGPLKRLHRWLGLSVGLLVALLGLTGSLLVFHRELDHFVLNRDLWRIEDAAPASSLSLAELAARVQAQRPDGRGHGADRPAFAGSRPLGYWEETGADGAVRYMTAALDPATGRIQGSFAWGELPPTRSNFTSVVYRLHYELFAGPRGTTVVGFVGLACLVLTGIGLYLWWPTRGRWRQRLTLKRGAPPVRRHSDLHNVAGATSGVVLAVLALSGAYMCFPDQFRSAIATIGAVTDEPALPALAAPRPGAAAKAEAAARRLVPAGRYDSFGLGAPGRPIRLAFREAGDPRHQLGSTRVEADPASGEVLRLRRPGDDTVADLVLRWQFPLHSGEALGLAGRVLVFVAGLAPTLLLWTGVRLWLARRRAHGRAAGRRRSPEPTGWAVAE
jgi:uncharacterized iron-regulated membrane protein